MNSVRKEASDISKQREQELLLFQKIAKIEFRKFELLNEAFTHSSFANENKVNNVKDNERLEFLGDSVLSIVVSDWLFKNIDGDEGEYTRIRSFVVSEDALYSIAKELTVDNYIRVGKGEEFTGGREKKAILADCMEAIFAAYYLDQGFEKVRQFILRMVVPAIQEVLSNKHKKDYKTMLQEYVQKHYKLVPDYRLIKTEGPDHNQKFYFSVIFKDKEYGPASGHTKKDAEQNVAKLAWKSLGSNKNPVN